METFYFQMERIKLCAVLGENYHSPENNLEVRVHLKLVHVTIVIYVLGVWNGETGTPKQVVRRDGFTFHDLTHLYSFIVVRGQPMENKFLETEIQF